MGENNVDIYIIEKRNNIINITTTTMTTTNTILL